MGFSRLRHQPCLEALKIGALVIRIRVAENRHAVHGSKVLGARGLALDDLLRLCPCLTPALPLA